MKRPVANIAHRGASWDAPELTVPAFDLACAAQATYIEVDVQMTWDGHLVVMHDPTMSRTGRCDGAGGTLIAASTLETLRRYDIGSWFNEMWPERAKPEFVGAKVLTLEEVLKRYAYKVNLVIEMKHPQRDPGVVDAIAEALVEQQLHEPARRWNVVVESASPSALLRFHGLVPHVPVFQIVCASDKLSRAGVREIDRYATGIACPLEGLRAETVAYAHERAIDIYVWTLNSRIEMQRALDLDVDGIMTDRPALLQQVLDRRNELISAYE